MCATSAITVPPVAPITTFYTVSIIFVDHDQGNSFPSERIYTAEEAKPNSNGVINPLCRRAEEEVHRCVWDDDGPVVVRACLRRCTTRSLNSVDITTCERSVLGEPEAVVWEL